MKAISFTDVMREIDRRRRYCRRFLRKAELAEARANLQMLNGLAAWARETPGLTVVPITPRRTTTKRKPPDLWPLVRELASVLENCQCDCDLCHYSRLGDVPEGCDPCPKDVALKRMVEVQPRKKAKK